MLQCFINRKNYIMYIILLHIKIKNSLNTVQKHFSKKIDRKIINIFSHSIYNLLFSIFITKLLLCNDVISSQNLEYFCS